MRYAENWFRVDIENLNLERLLIWCDKNIKGQQFIEENTIKFENEEDAALFKLEYKLIDESE